MLSVSEAAAKRVRTLIDNAPEAKDKQALRVGVKGGGCSGLSYFMEFTDVIKDNDKVVEREGVKVVVDAKSALYLMGTELDYVESLLGAGFKFKNPNVKSECGCGESFAV
jgi:iron-sulfur cluster assembly protein